MAIVAEYKFKQGIASINDACFAHKSVEEMAADRDRALTIARHINAAYIMRQMQKEEQKE